MRRYLGLASFLVAALWSYKWEIVRAFLYDRGFHFMSLMEAETWIHWGIPVALVGCGIYLFWRTGKERPTGPATRPKTRPSVNLPDGLPDVRVADHRRVAALFENEQRDILFPLMESEKLFVWARAMKGNDTLARLTGSVWKTHFLLCLPKEGQWERAVTFVKSMAGQQSIWHDVYFNQKQIEQIWPELEWIPLLTAARLAYETIEIEGLEKLFSSSTQTASQKITSIVDSLMAHDEVELWGKKPPSGVVRMITRDESHQLHHVPDTNNLGPVFLHEPHIWEDVVVLRADLNAYLAWVRDISKKAGS